MARWLSTWSNEQHDTRLEISAARLLLEIVGPEFGVKAAGGIRDAETFWAMVRAGANRIGTSAGVAIMDQIRSETQADRT